MKPDAPWLSQLKAGQLVDVVDTETGERVGGPHRLEGVDNGYVWISREVGMRFRRSDGMCVAEWMATRVARPEGKG